MHMVRFLFLGLIAFVHPIVQGSPGPLTALLVNATDVWRESTGMALPHHTAFLAVYPKDLDPSTACVDEAKDQFGQVLCTWLLNDEDITVETPLTPAGADNDAIAKMDNLLPEARSIKGECMEPKPNKDLVIGRFLLNSATLEATSLCAALQVKFHPLQMQAPIGAEKNAGEVAWSDASPKAGGGTVSLRLKKFGTLGQGRLIVVKVSETSGPIPVVIGNLHPGDQPEVCDPITKVPLPDDHFETFYRLATQERWSHERPVPFACCEPKPLAWLSPILSDLGLEHLVPPGQVTLLGLGSRIICPMAVFNPPG